MIYDLPLARGKREKSTLGVTLREDEQESNIYLTTLHLAYGRFH
jgi:hypothetical protein